jgi:hypothetical protein
MKLLERFRRARLKQKITAIVFFTIAVMLLFCFTVFTLATYVSGRRKAEQDLRDSFLRRQERLETYLARIDYTAYTIMFSNWVQQLMTLGRIVSRAEFQHYQ